MYDNTQYEVPLTVGTATLSLAAAADIARWSPALMPHYVRGVAVALNAAAGSAGVVVGDKRVTFASDTGRGAADVFTLNIPNGQAAGTVVYKENLSVLINPGEEVVIEVTTVVAALTAVKISLYVEPSWERPGNITAMKAST